MRILFLAGFIGGLILTVFAMLHGVEYFRPNRSRAPSPYFNLPNLAAFAVGFGATGYPLAAHTALTTWAMLLLALVGGVVAITGMTLLLARWALPALQTDAHADVEEIQGIFATVLREISKKNRGRIVYEHSGKRFEADAETLGNSSLPAGTEVVIDRIENGVAFVEEWTAVEQRL